MALPSTGHRPALSPAGPRWQKSPCLGTWGGPLTRSWGPGVLAGTQGCLTPRGWAAVGASLTMSVFSNAAAKSLLNKKADGVKVRLWLGPGGSGGPPTSACSVAQSPKLLWASPDSRKGYEPHAPPNGLSSSLCSPRRIAPRTVLLPPAPRGRFLQPLLDYCLLSCVILAYSAA